MKTLQNFGKIKINSYFLILSHFYFSQITTSFSVDMSVITQSKLNTSNMFYAFQVYADMNKHKETLPKVCHCTHD